MTVLFVILMVLASGILGFIILVQNPKGGGLAGNIAGFSNQFMGVKQTTDVLEKGTWIFAALIAFLCLFSAFFIPKTNAANLPQLKAKPSAVQTAPIQNPNQGNVPPPSKKP